MTPKSLRVAVIGGAGVFGSRLVDLLCRDGHMVWVVGRSKSADDVARHYNCQSLRLDRDGDLAALWTLKPDAMVDAAGPFQSYGDDPYRLPKACIAKGVHYLDLCDDTRFCSGIAALDAQAKKAGLAVISGMSTVPALSSAVAGHLTQDLAPTSIDIAILPGNRTDRGKSVTQAIMAQAGLKMQMTEGGQKTHARNWGRSRWFDLPQGHRRKGRLFNLPDIALLPDHFNAATVRTWAGLELLLLDFGLRVFAVLRRFGLPLRPWMVTLCHRFAQLLARFGSDAGGMVVSVKGHGLNGLEDRIWRVLVKDGQGPYTPTVAIRAALRDVTRLPVGAGPAMDVLKLDNYVTAMFDLPAEFETKTTAIIPVFQQVLGHDFNALPTTVRETHQVCDVHRFHGKAKVTRGTGVFGQTLAAVFGFPKATPKIDVSVTKTLKNGAETWVRQFGKARFKSVLRNRSGKMTETFWPFTFQLDLHVKNGQLHFPVKRGWVLGIPLPKLFLPTSVASEGEKEGAFSFDVKILAPITQELMVRYQGHLTPVSVQKESL